MYHRQIDWLQSAVTPQLHIQHSEEATAALTLYTNSLGPVPLAVGCGPSAPRPHHHHQNLFHPVCRWTH